MNRTGVLLFSGEGSRWSTVLKRTSVLLFSGEGNRWSNVLKRIDTLLFFGEENCWSTVLKRTPVHYCSEEKETGVLLFWRELVQYSCTQENKTVEEENWCSNSFKRKEVVKQITGNTVIKVGNKFLWNLENILALAFSRKIIGFIGLI